MCMDNLCFEQKYEKSKKNQPKIVIFTAVKVLLYIAWTCLRNVFQCHLRVERCPQKLQDHIALGLAL